MSLKNIGVITLYNIINKIIKDNDITTIDVICDTIEKDYNSYITGIVLTIENIRYHYYCTEENDILVVTILNLLVHNNNFKLPIYLDAIKISNGLIHYLASNEYTPLSCGDINILSKYYVNYDLISELLDKLRSFISAGVDTTNVGLEWFDENKLTRDAIVKILTELEYDFKYVKDFRDCNDQYITDGVLVSRYNNVIGDE